MFVFHQNGKQQRDYRWHVLRRDKREQCEFFVGEGFGVGVLFRLLQRKNEIRCFATTGGLVVVWFGIIVLIVPAEEIGIMINKVSRTHGPAGGRKGGPV